MSGAIFATNALRPAYSSYLRGFSFGPQIFIAEAAPWCLAWVVSGAVWLASAGGLTAWPGLAGAGFTALAVALLARVLALSLKTEASVAAALEAGGVAPMAAMPGKWRRALLPRWLNFNGVERIGNVRYADGDGSRHLLDVYRPAGGVSGAPVLLQIHGGAWVVGSKRTQGRPLVSRMARAGWVCVAINYRLSPRVRHPGHLVDCKLALKWIREHIAEYGGDPSLVVVTGGSAGGHLAALVALTANQPEYQLGFKGVDTSVAACVPVYGALDLEAVLEKVHPGLRAWFVRGVFGAEVKKASPINQLRPGVVPMLVVQGAADTLVPFDVARRFTAGLRAAGNSNVIHLELEGAGHAFDIFHSLRTEAVLAGIHRFLHGVVEARRSAVLGGAVNQPRREHPEQLGGGHRHEEAALAAVDVERR